MSYEYHSEIAVKCSSACPPHEANPADLVIWRKVKKPPAKLEDFLSDIETNKKNRDESNCQHWGCSVWPSEKAVLHARELFYWARKSFIVRGKLDPEDGQILVTPNPVQPEHCTFWKDRRIDVSSKFSLAFSPEKEPHQ